MKIKFEKIKEGKKKKLPLTDAPLRREEDGVKGPDDVIQTHCPSFPVG